VSDVAAEVWPSTCDLCEEDSTTPERCSRCGHRLRPIEPPVEPVRGAYRPAPFGDAVTVHRVAHRATLAELAAWALAQGRAVDLDVAALCLSVLDRERADEGIHLDRPTVNRLMWGSIRNEASLLGTWLPRTYVEDLWTVLRFCVATGRLTPGSDAEPLLLEPLQCYGGLDADGLPRPDGVDVDFPCQCYLPHDPTCPPGMVQISVGTDWDDEDGPFEYVVHAYGVPRSADVPMSAFEPLAKLARRSRAQPSMFPFPLDLFVHAGTVPAERSTPKLWLYRFTEGRRRGWPPLALDEHGTAWRAKRHRGRRRGFRWEEVSDRTAAHLCGVAAWDFEQARRERERRERWADEWEADGLQLVDGDRSESLSDPLG